MNQTVFGIRAGAPVEAIIDGVHVHSLSRGLNFDVDFSSLRSLLFNEYDCRRLSYFTKTVFTEEGLIEQPQIAKLLDFLRLNGFQTYVDEAAVWTTPEGRRHQRQNVDVAVAVAMMQAARRVGEIILFSGSIDLLPAVNACQQEGARVTVVSSLKTPTHTISQELRGDADWFVDMADLRDRIIRRERPDFRTERTFETGGDHRPGGSGEAEIIGRGDGTLGGRARITSRNARAV